MSSTDRDDTGFLSRWSRRKAQVRQGAAVQGEPVPAAGDAASAATQVAARQAEVPSLPAADAVLHPALQPAQTIAPAAGPDEASPKPPPPTLADVAQLTRDSDYTRFVAPDVDGEVRNAALKKLFGDPHFNVMDGLDVYIDDYGKPDPLPASALRQMAQAAFLGLIETPAETQPVAAHDGPTAATGAAEAAAPAALDDDTATPHGDVASTPTPHEDPDLRLQPHDAAGRGGAEEGAAANPAGER